MEVKGHKLSKTTALHLIRQKERLPPAGSPDYISGRHRLLNYLIISTNRFIRLLLLIPDMQTLSSSVRKIG